MDVPRNQLSWVPTRTRAGDGDEWFSPAYTRNILSDPADIDIIRSLRAGGNCSDSRLDPPGTGPGSERAAGSNRSYEAALWVWDVSKESLGIDGICSMGAGLVVLDTGESREIEGASCWLFFRSLA